MKKSIFFKYFTTCAALIMMSILILGSCLVIMSLQYSYSQKLQLYEPIARALSDYTSMQYIENDGQINADYMLQKISTYADATNADIFIVDNTGASKIGINGRIPFVFTKSISSDIMSILNSGKTYSENGNLGGMLKSQYTIYAVPIIVTTTAGDAVVGAVFIMSQSNEMLGFASAYIQVFLICAMIVLAVSFIIIYFVTSKLVSPLRQMSMAARCFGSGDFSKRVPVLSNDEIGQLAFAFNNMANSLSTLEDMRRSFVANVSHELKTPMTSIAGFIDGILDGTIPDSKRNYYLKIVSDEVKRLSRLVRSLLDIAKIEAGEIKINYTQFDVGEIIRRVLIGFERQIDEKNIEIKGADIEDHIMVISDPDLTHQIVYNLIENAVKFTNQGGCIEISVGDKDKKVYIGIRNTGMGIPSNDLPYVFDRFYKTDKSRGLDKKGIGLGLYIVKSTLKMQNQDIVVKSEEGKYCEFVFTLKKA